MSIIIISQEKIPFSGFTHFEVKKLDYFKSLQFLLTINLNFYHHMQNINSDLLDYDSLSVKQQSSTHHQPSGELSNFE